MFRITQFRELVVTLVKMLTFNWGQLIKPPLVLVAFLSTTSMLCPSEKGLLL